MAKSAASKKEALAGGFKMPAKAKTTKAVAVRHLTDSDADAFVKAGERQEPKAPPRFIRRKGKGIRVAVYMTPELFERLDERCRKPKRSISDAVEEAVREWLDA